MPIRTRFPEPVQTGLALPIAVKAPRPINPLGYVMVYRDGGYWIGAIKKEVFLTVTEVCWDENNLSKKRGVKLAPAVGRHKIPVEQWGNPMLREGLPLGLLADTSVLAYHLILSYFTDEMHEQYFVELEKAAADCNMTLEEMRREYVRRIEGLQQQPYK